VSAKHAASGSTHAASAFICRVLLALLPRAASPLPVAGAVLSLLSTADGMSILLRLFKQTVNAMCHGGAGVCTGLVRYVSDLVGVQRAATSASVSVSSATALADAMGWVSLSAEALDRQLSAVSTRAEAARIADGVSLWLAPHADTPLLGLPTVRRWLQDESCVLSSSSQLSSSLHCALLGRRTLAAGSPLVALVRRVPFALLLTHTPTDSLTEPAVRALLSAAAERLPAASLADAVRRVLLELAAVLSRYDTLVRPC
jgi:hypothetical protein